MLPPLQLPTLLTSCHPDKPAAYKPAKLSTYYVLLAYAWIFISGTALASASIKPTLDFKLVGTIMNGRDSPAYALIKKPHSSIRFFRIGDKLANLEIKTIERNKISLSQGKKIYYIHLQQRSNLAELATNNPTNNLNAKSLPINLQLKQQQLEHISNNIQQWLYAVPLKLVFTDGRASGYLVEDLRKLPFNGAIGLQKNDVIRAVNGIPVSQSEMFAQTVNSLMKLKDIYIEIERGHKINILHFNIIK